MPPLSKERSAKRNQKGLLGRDGAGFGNRDGSLDDRTLDTSLRKGQATTTASDMPTLHGDTNFKFGTGRQNLPAGDLSENGRPSLPTTQASHYNTGNRAGGAGTVGVGDTQFDDDSKNLSPGQQKIGDTTYEIRLRNATTDQALSKLKKATSKSK
jgi:hypothetical protein